MLIRDLEVGICNKAGLQIVGENAPCFAIISCHEFQSRDSGSKVTGNRLVKMGQNRATFLYSGKCFRRWPEKMNFSGTPNSEAPLPRSSVGFWGERVLPHPLPWVYFSGGASGCGVPSWLLRQCCWWCVVWLLPISVLAVVIVVSIASCCRELRCCMLREDVAELRCCESCVSAL